VDKINADCGAQRARALYGATDVPACERCGVLPFVTRNELTDGEQIRLNLVEGPFSQLQGHWEFASIGDSGCRVTFSTQFSFKSVLMEKTIGPVFNDICSRLVDSFVARARQVYS